MLLQLDIERSQILDLILTRFQQIEMGVAA